jgi:hypothetical protein
VKIRDKEVREPPHVTIIRGTKAWRIDLRTGQFMDALPDPNEISAQLMELITEEHIWRRLRNRWDRMYPSNPVSGDIGDEE